MGQVSSVGGVSGGAWVPHGVVFLGVLFTSKPLSTDVARKWLRLDMSASMHVQTSTLSELFTARVTSVRTVPGVGALMGRKVTGARELAVTPGTQVDRSATV